MQQNALQPNSCKQGGMTEGFFVMLLCAWTAFLMRASQLARYECFFWHKERYTAADKYWDTKGENQRRKPKEKKVHEKSNVLVGPEGCMCVLIESP